MTTKTAIAFAILLCACAGGAAISAANYATALEECNRTSNTCAESIACENKLRAQVGRPLRAQDGCR